MQEKVQQLEYLNEFSALLNSTLEPAIVKEKALEATCKLLRCETASLLLVDEKKADLYWETALGETGRNLQQNVRLPIDNRSIAGYVAMTGESVIVNDAQNDPRSFKNYRAANDPILGGEFVTRNMICVPLRAKNKTIGVLQALNKHVSLPKRPSRHAWPDFYEEDKKLAETLSHQVAIAIENSRLYTDIKKNFFETCESLAEAIEKKDRYTGGHTKRVVYYSMSIAEHLNLSSEDMEKLRLSAILHDVGKIGIEDKILKKESQLDPEEWKIMQSHTKFGYEIMRRVEGLKDVIGGMRFHHERWDGNGYPQLLKGEEIPLIARIISVADTFDAMVSTRPYRQGLAPELAYDEIIRCSGAQFDPLVVEAFVKAFKDGRLRKSS
ncbi:MAG TPA: phosphohydrolase [Bdellovibrionales bacterium]|nr:MAG: hypothetical protein A2Z97_12160 [Bdellovibrionales bacterium GWB1_52_6]OFZ03769.1 MAG: hypothetical protein A2X97_14145 [Bdellovibrionales bacterium GWA1_52_35]OFZ37483.1 MAG: hypothetical protein A2070_08405 [Bdellovibrionales bacterium GWC1_52_8]HAR44051.1 phosphohydrolase [Bdellovibrionales bacterium]HCM38792.1 phosphohydrolase [Bdellovibrionales bacterium]